MSRASTLEDSAKEFARRLAEGLPEKQNVSLGITNLSSLGNEDVARVAEAIKTGLLDRGVSLTDSAGAAATVSVSLSENWKELVWTGEIRQGDTTRLILLGIARDAEHRSASNSMHVTVRGERFWHGPKRILDAAEVSSPSGKSWLALLLPSAVEIEDLQSGSIATVEMVPNSATDRDPWGRLSRSESSADHIMLVTRSQVCEVSLEPPKSPVCHSMDEPGNNLPADPAQTGMDGGIQLGISPVCGESNQFLATAARDYTQTDTVQVFEMESSGPVAMSAELNFPGPILALHAFDVPTAIVRNLSTGNYEAYRLAISCSE